MSLAMKIAAAAKRVGGALETDKRNNEQKYDYISADKILQKCGQALAEEGVTVFPSIVNQTVETVEYRQGRVRYDVSVEFVFFVADSDSQMELPWIGRGADYAVPDKAAYKAITSGHKYFLAKMLNIGVGNEDGEHEAAEQPEQHKPAQRNAKPAPKKAAGGAQNGKPAQKTAAPATWQKWETPDDAKEWAIKSGACDGGKKHADAAFAKIVNDEFGGECKTSNLQDIFKAFYLNRMEAMNERATEATTAELEGAMETAA